MTAATTVAQDAGWWLFLGVLAAAVVLVLVIGWAIDRGWTDWLRQLR